MKEWIIVSLFLMVTLFAPVIMLYCDDHSKHEIRSHACEKMAKSVQEYKDCMENKK